MSNATALQMRPRLAPRGLLHVSAFQCSTQHLTRSASVFPTPFGAPSQGPKRASVELSPTMETRREFWAAAGRPQLGDHLLLGSDAYRAYIEAFQKAYSPAYMAPVCGKVVAVSERDRAAFVFFATQVTNTGAYGGLSATRATSTVHGVYRLAFNEGGAVASAWCHRSPTAEEFVALLAKPSRPVNLDLIPCTWPADDGYTSRILNAASDWMDEVCSKASIQALFKLAVPDLQYIDGTGMTRLAAQPAAGFGAFMEQMVTESSTFQLGPRTVLASAADLNKVFVHWSQAAVCRKTHDASDIEGVSMLMFNKDAQVVQVVEYRTPSNQDLEQLFRPAAHATAASSEGAVKAAPKWDAETADALARQAQEWSSW